MDVHHIKYFLAVCDTLNFTRAAEACNVTQPALSRAIQQLEDEVGGLLFRRERSLTHITDLGLVMQPRLRQIMDELSHARRDAKRFLAQDTARLSIGVMCTIAPLRLAGLIAEFGRRNPGIAVRVEEGTPERLKAKLEKRSVDLAVLATSVPLDALFECAPLYDERFVVALPAGHRLLSSQAVPVGLLDGEAYLSRINCEQAESIGEACASRGVRLHNAYASEREDWIQNLVAAGLGIAMIPEFSAVAPGLQLRPIVEPEFWRCIGLVKLASSPLSAAAQTFSDFIRSYSWPQGRFGALSSAA